MNLSTDLSTSSSIQKSAYSQTDAPITVSPKGSAALSGLSSGQTFQAEVVSREGNEATLRLENGQTVNARLGSEIPLEPGKLLTFEVRQSGQTLSISPLQTNLSADPNAVRALQMANLPISGTSVEMTTLMMKAGMSIDRASLQQMLSRVTANPGAGPGDIIDLTRLGMKVTPENLEQLSAYKNLSYQIGDGMREVAGKLSDALMQLTGAGAGDASVSGGVDLSAASSLMQGLLEAAAAFEDAAGTGAVPAAAQGAETAAGNQVMADPGQVPLKAVRRRKAQQPKPDSLRRYRREGPRQGPRSEREIPQEMQRLISGQPVRRQPEVPDPKPELCRPGMRPPLLRMPLPVPWSC